MEGCDERAVRNETAVGRGEPGRNAADRAREAAEDHGGARSLQVHELRQHRGGDHHQDGFEDPDGDAQRDDFGAGADGRTGDRSDDIGDRAGTDRGQADGVAIAEGIRDADSDDERQESTDEKGDRADPAGTLSFCGLDFEGRGDDGEIAQHISAHERKSAEVSQVGESFAASGHTATDIGEGKSDENCDGGALDATKGQFPGEETRTENDQSDDGEGKNQAVIDGKLLEKRIHGS